MSPSTRLLPLAAALLLVCPPPAEARAAQEPPPEVPAGTSAEAGFDARFEAARQRAFSGQRDAALAALTALLAESPGNGDVLLVRGRVYAWEGRYAEAEADLRAVTESSPTYADAWSALGDLYAWSDRPALAADAYARWAALEPEAPAPPLARARALRSAGRLDEARAALDEASARGAPAEDVQSLRLALEPRTRQPEASAPEGYDWSASVSAGRSDFSPDRGAWNDHGASLRRYFEHGSLALEWLGARRFGRNDQALALDAYVDLWPRAYANLRWQQSLDDELFPERSMRAEVYQGLGSGWELSLSYDRLDFAERTEIYGAGVGYYVGDFYLRLRRLHIPGADADTTSHRGLVRWYYAGTADDYFEVNGGSGRSTETLIDEDSVRRSDSRSFGLAWSHYFTPAWGLKLSASTSEDSGDGYRERAVGASLYRRW